MWPIPVDGGWSAWEPLTNCSVSCGTGIRRAVRYCTAPAPSLGGADCVGKSNMTQLCSKGECPSEYSHWLHMNENECHRLSTSYFHFHHINIIYFRV